VSVALDAKYENETNNQSYGTGKSLMIKALPNYFFRHKYKLALYAMLGIATIICMILVKMRMKENYEDNLNYYYSFMLRNLSLAWTPLLIALITSYLKLPHKIFHIIVPFICMIWLIFFPNAPYLLTDFQHIRLYSDSPKIWFDVNLLVWFAFTALFLGLISLYLMHQVVQREFGHFAGWAFVFITGLLSSTGIYIGRYLRFNSWDVFNNPARVIQDLVTQSRDPNAVPITFVFLYTLFLIFIYILFYIFGNLLHEDSQG